MRSLAVAYASLPSAEQQLGYIRFLVIAQLAQNCAEGAVLFIAATDKQESSVDRSILLREMQAGYRQLTEHGGNRRTISLCGDNRFLAGSLSLQQTAADRAACGRIQCAQPIIGTHKCFVDDQALLL